jgi:DNA-binding beta-propeller fold protein YncE
MRAAVLSSKIFLAGALLFALPRSVRAAEPLVLDRTIALNDVSGRIDHMAIDLGRQRLFVAELGNGTLDVIDLVQGKAVRRIGGLKEPQGVAYAPGADVVAVANGGDGTVRMFRGADLVPAGKAEFGEDADNLRFDARTGLLVVGYGSGGLAMIDPATASLIGRIPLPAHPEGFQLDPANHRAFINVPDARQITIVDLAASRQTATWRLPNFRANFPMAFDAERSRVAVAFRSPPRLVILDANDGRVIGNLPSCGDADDVFFDGKRNRIYVSCGDGTVDVWLQQASGYGRLGSIPTSPGARTALFVSQIDRLFVAARAGYPGLGSAAAILVFRPAD